MRASAADALLPALQQNLMQAYVNNEVVMALMARHWRDFVSTEAAALTDVDVVTAATAPPRPPQHVFHGMSQGGIFGAGVSGE